MQEIKNNEFDSETLVYIIIKNDIICVSFKYYQENKKKYKGKVLVLAHPEVPVYFRKG